MIRPINVSMGKCKVAYCTEDNVLHIERQGSEIHIPAHNMKAIIEWCSELSDMKPEKRISVDGVLGYIFTGVGGIVVGISSTLIILGYVNGA